MKLNSTRAVIGYEFNARPIAKMALAGRQPRRRALVYLGYLRYADLAGLWYRMGQVLARARRVYRRRAFPLVGDSGAQGH